MLRRCQSVLSSVVSFGGASLIPQTSAIKSADGVVKIASNFGVGDRSLDALALKEEEKRVARHEKLFEGLVVYEGGNIKDHKQLGNEVIFRDFIQYALYHNKWGYYSKLHRKYREEMTKGFFDPVPFGSIRNRHDYEIYAGKLSEATPTFITPPSLFQPYYGWVIAEYMLTVMRSKFDPQEPLIIYEVGAGTGHLALTILNYLAEYHPGVYANCEYHLIDINPLMIQIQRNKLVHHFHKVKLHNISILNWRELEKRRCFVLAFEVLSGLPHDLLTWSHEGTSSEQWMKFISKDMLGTAAEVFRGTKDPVLLRYLRYANWLIEESHYNLKVLCLTDGKENLDPPEWAGLLDFDKTAGVDVRHLQFLTKMLTAHLPWQRAYVPTGQLLMLETLAQFFPRHHALFADWNEVKQGVAGKNGPLCQVKIRISRDIYLRRSSDEGINTNAGMTDICFPTDFQDLSRVYGQTCGEHKEIITMTHPQFWKTFGGDKTGLFTTQSGFNPLLEDFTVFGVFASNHPAEC